MVRDVFKLVKESTVLRWWGFACRRMKLAHDGPVLEGAVVDVQGNTV
jgi:hypothetical protein